ncbi:MAG TPA: NAD-dependent epimerase/dehydratase family protein [Terriglobales bacterium]|jgi:uncharacterized protein YbjT (DUF2867 family)|nr:NAD-dependent epimerase/dehydratase family protein [Terriglobales bacterium]
MDGRTAVIAGASGLVGSHCLQALLSRYERVIALGRRHLPLEHVRLEQRVVDFEEIGSIEFHADDVFSALGGILDQMGWEKFSQVERDYPIALARRAAQLGARQFLVVSTVDVNFGAKWKRYTALRRELEAAASALPFHAVHIFRPGMLLGKREKFRLGEGFLGALSPLINLPLHGGWRKYRAIAGREVGRAMVAAALQAEPGIHIYHHDQMRALAASLKEKA